MHDVCVCVRIYVRTQVRFEILNKQKRKNLRLSVQIKTLFCFVHLMECMLDGRSTTITTTTNTTITTAVVIIVATDAGAVGSFFYFRTIQWIRFKGTFYVLSIIKHSFNMYDFHRCC